MQFSLVHYLHYESYECPRITGPYLPTFQHPFVGYQTGLVSNYMQTGTHTVVNSQKIVTSTVPIRQIEHPHSAAFSQTQLVLLC